MTWRTFFYLTVVGFAITVTLCVASEVLAQSPTVTLGAVEPTTLSDDPSNHWVLLVAGISMVILTYRQAYLNFRR